MYYQFTGGLQNSMSMRQGCCVINNTIFVFSGLPQMEEKREPYLATSPLYKKGILQGRHSKEINKNKGVIYCIVLKVLRIKKKKL